MHRLVSRDEKVADHVLHSLIPEGVQPSMYRKKLPILSSKYNYK